MALDETSPNEGAACVLVVDDEPHVRQMAERMLSRRGFVTLGAAEGEEAVRLVGDDDPHVDVVLLDLSMPGMSGPETLQVLRRDRPELPVVLCSGYDVDCASFAAEYGQKPQAILRKPFGMDQLAEAVQQSLPAAH